MDHFSELERLTAENRELRERNAELEREVLDISDAERRRIARELHDGLCQELGGMALLAGALAKKLTEIGGREREIALELSEHMYNAVSNTREIARGLEPVEIDGSGLAGALEELAATLRRRVECEFRCSGRIVLPNGRSAANFYQIAQDATADALRRANAGKIEIGLSRSADRLVLTVEDDGIASSHVREAVPEIRIMKYRARAIGARLEFTEREGGGTIVRCSVRAVRVRS